MMGLDTSLSDERVDEWLTLAWSRRTDDSDLDELARAGHIGWRGPVPTARIVELLPTNIAFELGADITIRAVKITGQALWDATDELSIAAHGSSTR
jgi:hypothetical protein